MSDDTRSKILNILRTKRSSIDDLENELDKQGISISQTAIRQHLTQLENNDKSIGKKAIREGKGRPRYMYYVKQESSSAYPKRYSFLLQLVLSKLIDENGKEYNVYFSSIVGEHTTFKIEKANVVEKYGEDSSAYLDYFTKKLKLFVEKDK